MRKHDRSEDTGQVNQHKGGIRKSGSYVINPDTGTARVWFSTSMEPTDVPAHRPVVFDPSTGEQPASEVESGE